MTSVLFVNSGIMGMASFAQFIRDAMTSDPEIDASHINLSEDLSVHERRIRALLCARLWHDGWFGLKNMDLERLRSEYHAGLQASRRIGKIMADKPIDVIHFHRQGTAYGSIRLMARMPTIVSIDATQDIMIDAAPSHLEKWSYRPNASDRWQSVSRREGDRLNITVDGGLPSSPLPGLPDAGTCDAACLSVFAPSNRAGSRSEGSGREFRVIGRTSCSSATISFAREDRSCCARGVTAVSTNLATLDIVTNWPVPPPDVPGINVIHGVAAYSREWSDVWKSADVFVLPARQEAFGTVFQEAAAAGLPRIGTRISAIPETIHDHEDGFLVTPGDRAGLIAALRRLIGSADLREEFGRAGRRNAEQFGPDAYVSGLRAIVRAVVPRPS